MLTYRTAWAVLVAAVSGLLLSAAEIRADIIYVGNTGNNTVTVINNGVTSTIPTGSVTPFSLAVDGNNTIYIGNDTNTVYTVTPGGTVTPFFQGGRTDQFVSLASDGNGNVYFLNSPGQSILKATPGGSVTPFASVVNPQALAFFQGTPFVLTGHQIVNLATGAVIFIGNAGGVFTPTASLAIDGKGNFYTQTGNNAAEVVKFFPTGASDTSFLYDIFPNGNYGLAFGSNGFLYDAVNNNPPGYHQPVAPSSTVVELDPVNGNVVNTLTGFDDPGPIVILASSPNAAAAPEPSSLVLLGSAAVTLATGWFRGRRRPRAARDNDKP
jgi:YVTN family beta-propeller protein